MVRPPQQQYWLHLTNGRQPPKKNVFSVGVIYHYYLWTAGLDYRGRGSANEEDGIISCWEVTVQTDNQAQQKGWQLAGKEREARQKPTAVLR